MDSVATKSMPTQLTQQHLKVPSLQFEQESGGTSNGNSNSKLSSSGNENTITKYSNTSSLQQHSERYLDDDKYAVLDFNANTAAASSRQPGRGASTPKTPNRAAGNTPTTSKVPTSTEVSTAVPTSTEVPTSPSEFVMLGYDDAKCPPPTTRSLSAPPNLGKLSPVAEMHSSDEKTTKSVTDDDEVKSTDESKFVFDNTAGTLNVPESSLPMASANSASDEDEDEERKSLEDDDVEEEEEESDDMDLPAMVRPLSISEDPPSRSRSPYPSEAADEPPTLTDDAPPLPAQSTISSIIMSSVMRLRSLNDAKSKSCIPPKPLKIKKKLPRMYTYLFRNDGTILMKLALPPGMSYVQYR